jgi:GT2 family glycosyltransferase/ubiquinone/menaquinone biosynthesis C-methylase UbiE
MKSTGERYTHASRGKIDYEHLRRYALSLDFVVGKTVLDIAAGKGYGAAILARVATSVTGLDIDPASVEHAKRACFYPNLNFLVGRYEKIPLPDASVDVVTSFETIERHNKHEEMMLEVKRVLKPGGLLILSAPNRLRYSDEPGDLNPFRIKELYRDDLHHLLNKHFKYHRAYGQKLAAESFLLPLRGARANSFKAFTGNPDQSQQHLHGFLSPIYFVVVYSDDSAIEKQELSSIYLARQDDLLKNLETERIGRVDQLQAQSQNSIETLARAGSTYEAQAQQQADELLKAGTDFGEQVSEIASELSNASPRPLDYEEELIRRAEELYRVRATYESQLHQQEEALSAAHAQLSIYESQLEQQATVLAEVQSKLLKKGEVLQWVQMSRPWQVASSIERVRQGLYQFRQLNHKFLRKFHLPGQGGFYGAIDFPYKSSHISKYLEVSGWVFSTAAPVVRIEAFLDNLPLGAAQYGQARPDVTDYFRSQAPVACGYQGRFLVDKFLSGRRTLRVRVWDAEGNLRDYVRTVFVDEADDKAGLDSAGIAVPEKAPGALEKVDDPVAQNQLSASKRLLTSLARISLESFLNSNATIEIDYYEQPEISIILVLYNRAELTLQCLYSILKSNVKSFEIIIVDNASTDETKLLLERIKGAQIIENETNAHYLLACNQAARRARGEYLLLLNNDTQVLADSISSALRTLQSSPDVGAVGGKIILPDGTLQEAGSIIWQDGSCLGYGRGDSPLAPAYMFMRDVDYCSAAFLLTRLDLFLEDGGFDEDYAPAYYEDTDYCARLWEKGKRIVYDPNVIVLHYEFASSVSQQSAINQAIMNRSMFAHKNHDWLRFQRRPSQENILEARIARRRGGQRVLFIDGNIPHASPDSRVAESNRLLAELVKMGHFITLYPLDPQQVDWSSIYRDIPREVEVMADYGLPRLEEFLDARSAYYDLIFISDPNHMAALEPLLIKSQLYQRARVCCGAQELFSLEHQATAS